MTEEIVHQPQPPYPEGYLESLQAQLKYLYPQFGWSLVLIEESLRSFDDGLGETHLDHLECLSDHAQLVQDQNNQIVALAPIHG